MAIRIAEHTGALSSEPELTQDIASRLRSMDISIWPLGIANSLRSHLEEKKQHWDNGGINRGNDDEDNDGNSIRRAGEGRRRKFERDVTDKLRRLEARCPLACVGPASG